MASLNNSQVSFIRANQDMFRKLPKEPFLFKDIETTDKSGLISFLHKADERGLFVRHGEVDGRVVREVREGVWRYLDENST